MMKRQKVPQKKSQRQFHKTAKSRHPFNSPMAPRFVMRGGIRM